MEIIDYFARSCLKIPAICTPHFAVYLSLIRPPFLIGKRGGKEFIFQELCIGNLKSGT